MVITPQQAKKIALQANEANLVALEKRIDAVLVEKFTQGDTTGVCMHLDAGFCPGGLLYNELRRRYNQAGWTVTYESDQRDGDFLRFNAGRQR